MRSLRVLVASAVLCSTACREDPPAATRVVASVLIDGDKLSLITTHPVSQAPFVRQPAGPRLRYRFLGEAGEELAAGEVGDPRRLRVDGREAGTVRGRVVQVPYGVLELELPPRQGELSLSEQDRVIARGRLSPGTGSALMDPTTDLLATEKVSGNAPPEQALDIAILAEGYTEQQLPEFRATVAQAVAGLAARTDLGRHWSRINVWRLDVRSRQSGIDDPPATVDTAFDTAFGVGGDHICTFFTDGPGLAAAVELGRRAQADVVVALANSTVSGGCASGRFIVMTRDELVATLAHELGHAAFGLIDEYPGAGPCDGPGPNVSVGAERSSLPWAPFVKTDTPLPTPDTSAYQDLVGAFQGAGTCDTGRFRPAHDCVMRGMTPPACPVCACEMTRYFCELTHGAQSCTVEAACLNSVPATGECTATLSGAASASYRCGPPYLMKFGPASGYVFVWMLDPPGSPGVTLSLELPGDAPPELNRDYATTDFTKLNVGVFSGGEAYMALRNMPGVPDKGTARLRLSAMTCAADVCSSLDGQLEATLVGETTGGTVQLVSKF